MTPLCSDHLRCDLIQYWAGVDERICTYSVLAPGRKPEWKLYSQLRGSWDKVRLRVLAHSQLSCPRIKWAHGLSKECISLNTVYKPGKQDEHGYHSSRLNVDVDGNLGTAAYSWTSIHTCYGSWGVVVL